MFLGVVFYPASTTIPFLYFAFLYFFRIISNLFSGLRSSLMLTTKAKRAMLRELEELWTLEVNLQGRPLLLGLAGCQQGHKPHE